MERLRKGGRSQILQFSMQGIFIASQDQGELCSVSAMETCGAKLIP